MSDAMGCLRQMCREFAVFFAAAGCAVLLALPTTMLGSTAIHNDGRQTDRSFSAPDTSADYELMMAALHWQAKLALADLQRAAKPQ